MPINFDSISNLSPDLQRIFAATMKAETKPIKAIEDRKSSAEERLKLLNTVLGKVEEVKKLLPGMNTPLAIRELNVNTTDDKIATGTADKNVAEMGEHSLEVFQLASTAAALSNRFPDKDETRIGTGYFTFYGPNGDSKEVFIDNENATLEGIARVINQADVGMRANVVNDQTDPDNPYRLVLSAKEYGAGHTVEYPEFYFIDGETDFYIEEEREPTNAKIRYQGFDIEAPTNEIKELIGGVTLNLRGITPNGKPLGVAIEQDIPKTVTKMKDIVTGLNGVLGFIQEQNKMDKDTPGYKTLGGDYGIRMAEQRIRSLIHQNFSGSFSDKAKIRLLSDMGIEFMKDGLLKFDEKKFEHALDANFDETIAYLTGNGFSRGFMNQLGSVLSSLTAPGSGLLSNEKVTYQDRVKRMNEDIEKKEKDLEKKSEILKNKLAKIQGAFSQLQSQQAALGGVGAGAMMPAGPSAAPGPSPK